MAKKTDKGIDETIARAKKNIAASKALIETVDAAQSEYAAWKEENGVTDEKLKKFTESLSGEDKKRYDEAREELERQTRQDLEDIAARGKAMRAKGTLGGARARRGRSFA